MKRGICFFYYSELKTVSYFKLYSQIIVSPHIYFQRVSRSKYGTIIVALYLMQSLKTKIHIQFSTLKIVLVRHGQSESNQVKKWSGWYDAKLSSKGQQEAAQCGLILKKEKLQFDQAYCSRLTRTIKTLNIILDQLDMLYLPVRKCWELNQKFYGAFQELNKMDIVRQYGEQIVNQWRRSYYIAPPKLFIDDLRHPIHDRRYRDVDPSLLPCTENLGDVIERVRKLYEVQIKKQLRQGKRLLIVCHGSSLRAWTNILLGFNYDQLSKFHVPTGIPLMIELDQNLRGVKWQFLGDKSILEAKLKKLRNQLKQKDE